MSEARWVVEFAAYALLDMIISGIVVIAAGFAIGGVFWSVRKLAAYTLRRMHHGR